jgi:Na+/proline symporter
MMTGVAFVVGSLSNAVYQQEPEVFARAADLTGVPGQEEKVLRDESGALMTQTKDGIVSVLLKATQKDENGNDVLDENGTPKHVAVPAFSSATCKKVESGYDKDKAITDEIIPRYLTAKMPPWFLYVFMVTILAAAMSTISSQFHAMGTSIGRDFYEQAIRRGRGTKATVLTTRIGMLIAIVATILISFAIAKSPYVIAKVTALFFGLCAAAFLPTYLGALYWRRMTRAGATASIVMGFLVSFFWLTCMGGDVTKGVSLPKLFGAAERFLVNPASRWQFVDAIVIALPISAIVAIVVSLMSKPEPKEHLDKCFRGVNNR